MFSEGQRHGLQIEETENFEKKHKLYEAGQDIKIFSFEEVEKINSGKLEYWRFFLNQVASKKRLDSAINGRHMCIGFKIPDNFFEDIEKLKEELAYY